MRVEREASSYVTFVLSRRNLQTLLQNLDEPARLRHLFVRAVDGEIYHVKAEDDDVHATLNRSQEA